MDYFLSSDLMEPEGGESHYSEKLVRLPGLMSSYPKPKVELAKEPSIDLKALEDRTRYLCLQSLYKLLPQYDFIFPAIARSNPKAHFGFIEESSGAATDVFRKRLESAFLDVDLDPSKYFTIYPRLSQFEFYGLARSADVILDSLLWSGNNSSMEASAFGKPIVTWAGPMMQWTPYTGDFEARRVEDTIAPNLEAYVQLAADLGQNESLRAEITEKIVASHAQLYDNLESVRGLEEFLISL